jgi:hypothetical protein
MRRTMLMAVAAACALTLPAGALAVKKKPKHHASAPTIKVGTYRATAQEGAVKFNITLKKASCAAPGPGGGGTHLCVSLPSSPELKCVGVVAAAFQLGDYSKPVALSPAGAALVHSSVTGSPAVPGGAPSTGSSAFSVSFTKKGTATGYMELTMMISAGSLTEPCSSGKVSFTAKLG